MDAVLGAIAIATAAYVIGYPLFVAELPPITDLPFHATAVSVFRHYWDPAWQFGEQFTLHPLEAPYLSMFVVGAVFALFMPIAAATKASAFVMLALLPIGLSVLLRGMQKSALWAIASLGLIWSNLAWWGFFNHIGALGLSAMAVGFTLLCVQSPTRGRRVALALSLLGVFFTHIFRFPFAILCVAAALLCVCRDFQSARPLLLPIAPSLVIFTAWLVFRPKGMQADFALDFQPERLNEAWAHATVNFVGESGEREQRLFRELSWLVVLSAGVLSVCALVRHFRGRANAGSASARLRFAALGMVLVAGYVTSYFSLPIEIGSWWYVYPREVVSVAYFALACLPSLPSTGWLRASAIVSFAFATGRIGLFAAEEAHEFASLTEDFRAIKREVKEAPRLMYLIFDHTGSTRSVTPFIHLPAWIQAEKGGALSFHFIGLAHGWPIRYRTDTNAVPPPFPHRWEWTPQRYVHSQHGAWFDEFLIRSRRNPSYLFRADATVVPIAQHGTWWLFRRLPRSG